MPKTAMHEYDLAPPDKHQVRSSRKVPTMQPISVSHAVHQASNRNFRAGIFGSHTSHDFRAPLRADRIHSCTFPLLLKQGPLLANISFDSVANNPCDRYFLLLRNAFKRCVDLGGKAHRSPGGFRFALRFGGRDCHVHHFTPYRCNSAAMRRESVKVRHKGQAINLSPQATTSAFWPRPGLP